MLVLGRCPCCGNRSLRVVSRDSVVCGYCSRTKSGRVGDVS